MELLLKPESEVNGQENGLYRNENRNIWIKYLLDFLSTFSGWVEAYPTKKETANIVAKKLLRNIIPKYGLPTIHGSDNRPAFNL